jgi:hypothetical protein
MLLWWSKLLQLRRLNFLGLYKHKPKAQWYKGHSLKGFTKESKIEKEPASKISIAVK